MEMEYKWDMPDGQVALRLVTGGLVVGIANTEPRAIHMHAIYYDTPDGLVAANQGGLRLRHENDGSVCCLKLSAQDETGCKVRYEYEVPADDIREGIARLPESGAPRDLCEQLQAGELVVLCETEYDRMAYDLKSSDDADGSADFEAELAIDLGAMRRNGNEAAIREIELEFKSGDKAAFHEHAKRIEGHFSLTPQPLSKLARAMAL